MDFKFSFFKKSDKRKDEITAYEYHHRPMKPERDWRILIGVFFAVFFLSLLGSFYLYSTLFADPDVSSEAGNPLSSIHQEKLEETLRLFGERRTRYERYRNGAPEIIDPSL